MNSMIFIIKIEIDVRRYGYWYNSSGCVLPGGQFCVNVAVELVVDVVVADVLQRCSTGGAFEALDVKIFLLYSYEYATKFAKIHKFFYQ